MNAAKIHLSAEELALVQNGSFLLTKNTIIQKVYTLFGDLSAELNKYYEGSQFPVPDTGLSLPKIAKGENFRGLPYVMLDFPRFFGKEDIAAIRSFFWWGNNFTVTLHCKGLFKQELANKIATHALKFQEAGFRICLNGDEWEHDTEAACWKEYELDNITATQIEQASFCKIACSIPLHQWQRIDVILMEKHHLLATLFND